LNILLSQAVVEVDIRLAEVEVLVDTEPMQPFLLPQQLHTQSLLVQVVQVV
jgi:hypothetical protein